MLVASGLGDFKQHKRDVLWINIELSLIREKIKFNSNYGQMIPILVGKTGIIYP